MKSWVLARAWEAEDGFKPEDRVLLGFILHSPISRFQKKKNTVTALAPRPPLSPGTPLCLSQVL